ncbi:MAG: hypothetical protein QOJ51_2493 [Acidobacteriaceae bacterium]|jgi:hypothetical protein|nr:hypothetical protein [Acidobacteriaceae bacterium]
MTGPGDLIQAGDRYEEADPGAGGAKKSAVFKPKEWVGKVRELWAKRASHALKPAEKKERIDHHSYAAREIEQIPTVHEGPNVRQLVKDKRLAPDPVALTSETCY